MTLAGRIAWDDTILPFQLDRADVRGRVGRLDTVLETILGQHDYPAPVAALVAEATLITALIGQTIKLRWRLSLQVRSDGPVRLIATDYFGPTADGEPAKMRAYAAYDAEAIATASAEKPFDLFGEGVFAILIDQGPGTTPYQGITPIAGASLADCAETYFAQSEQLPTRFALAMGEAVQPGGESHWRGGGVLLQHMPKASPHARQEETSFDDPTDDLPDESDDDNWRRAVMLLGTVEETELVGPHVGAEQLLLRLFSEEDPRVYPTQSVRFGCTCGPEKVVQTLALYGPEDIASMTTTDGKVTADCQFCGAHYEFDPSELGTGAVARDEE